MRWTFVPHIFIVPFQFLITRVYIIVESHFERIVSLLVNREGVYAKFHGRSRHLQCFSFNSAITALGFSFPTQIFVIFRFLISFRVSSIIGNIGCYGSIHRRWTIKLGICGGLSNYLPSFCTLRGRFYYLDYLRHNYGGRRYDEIFSSHYLPHPFHQL